MKRKQLVYRLGLDLGTNSIGWCVYGLNDAREPFRVERLGVRIFSEGRDPKSKTSLAADRRLARSMRRRRDRYLSRRKKLSNALVRHALFPADPKERESLASVDPYVLRARALDQPLTPHELGRVLFHLNQRRGFKSNRKVDKGDKERGKISEAVKRTREELSRAGCRTYGEWLAKRHERREPVRARLRGKGASSIYDLYPSRDLLESEFDAIWTAQAKYHALSTNVRDEIRSAIFFQRPLKPVKPGKCTLIPTEPRAALALPSVQRFRIYQEVNNLRLVGPDLSLIALTLAERDQIVQVLERRAKLDFDQIRKLLGKGGRFNLESEKRTALRGNSTSVALGKKGAFGAPWHDLPPERQDEIVSYLMEEESEERLLARLESEFGLSSESAVSVTQISFVEGYGRLSLEAIRRLLPYLKLAVITYDDAARRAGFASHSDFYDGEIRPDLPYYGQVLTRHVAFDSSDPDDPPEKRYGKIANPTVHITLNQMRLVVNALIERYGHPAQIAVETARDLPLGAQGRSELLKEQRDNQERNDRIRDELLKLGLQPNVENITRYKLWEELNLQNVADRRCVYSGQQISLTMLFSDAVEIDHILPFSRTLDDSLANKTVCVRQANRDKGNGTPYEAFGPGGYAASGYRWEEIVERAKVMGRARYRLFSSTAIEERMKGEDFLARQLNDTRYISRIAREYLSAICPPAAIVVLPGRLTALLRSRWGLNSLLSGGPTKTRDDHRHHAIDAAVVAATDRSMLQRLATAAERAGERGLTRLVEEMPEPWAHFREAIQSGIKRVVVSHRPDHSPLAQLHNDTAYGLRGEPDKRGAYLVVHRIPIDALTKPQDVESVAECDARLAARLRAVTNDLEGKAFASALADFAQRSGIRRVRVGERLSVIPIKDRRDPSRTYKAYKGDSNYCIEIFRSEAGGWRSKVIPTFEACQIYASSPEKLRDTRRAQNGASLVMRLCCDDLIAFGEGPDRKLMRVAVITTSGTIALCEHFEANVDRRNRDKSFKYTYKSASSMLSAKARRVFVTPLGFVLDPGFKP